MSLFGGSSDGGAAKMERARQAAIKSGMQDLNRQFSQFTPDFYQQAATDYTKAQTPEVMQDYQATRNNLTYALSRNGNLKSSTALQRDASLSKELSKNESLIANQAQGTANDLRARVNQQKGALVQQLEASADPTATSEMATASAAQLRAPSPIQPLGNLFADWSSQYLTNQAQNPDASVWSKLSGVGLGQPNAPMGSSYMA